MTALRRELNISKTELQLTKNKLDEKERRIAGILIREQKYILYCRPTLKTINSQDRTILHFLLETKDLFLSSIIAVFIFFFLPIASHSCPLSFDNSDNCLTIVKYFHPVFIDALKLTLSTLHSSTVESSQIIVKLTTQKLVHAGGQS